MDHSIAQANRGSGEAREETLVGSIDCDIHNDEGIGFEESVLPYLTKEWASYITNGGSAGLPRLYTPWQGAQRRDSWLADGRSAAVSYEDLKSQHLDAWNFSFGILTGPGAHAGVCYLAQYEFASALARAINDLTIDKWLGRDERLRGSIIVAAQDPTGSAREIHRVAAHPDMVQILLPTRSPGGASWGDEKYYPIWEAAQQCGVAVAFHQHHGPGNVYPPTTAGWPRSYMEMSSCIPVAAQSELTAIICRGILEKFPNSRIVLVENGVSWLPAMMWRLDKRWRELRAEVPWLRRPPSSYIRESVRLTTQPFEEPGNQKHLLQLIDMMGSDRMLMFSSDYPHWDFDSPTRALPGVVPADLRRRILTTNAEEFYSLSRSSRSDDVVEVR